jgi:hypothetical protein
MNSRQLRDFVSHFPGRDVKRLQALLAIAAAARR